MSNPDTGMFVDHAMHPQGNVCHALFDIHVIFVIVMTAYILF